MHVYRAIHWGMGKVSGAAPTAKSDSSFPDDHQLPVAPLLWKGSQEPFPQACWNCNWLDLVQGSTATVSLCVQLPCHAQKIAFCSTLPHPSALLAPWWSVLFLKKAFNYFISNKIRMSELERFLILQNFVKNKFLGSTPYSVNNTFWACISVVWFDKENRVLFT